MRDTKILHLVAGELNGGAAKGAYNLHLALTKKHINSFILTNAKQPPNAPNTDTIYHNKLETIIAKCKTKIDTSLVYIYPKRFKRIFSNNIIGTDFLHTEAYKRADIIHLHWINAGFVAISDIARIDKPIVWTLRDMWAMSGGCHYSIGDNTICERYRDECGHCEMLRSHTKYDLSYFNLQRKHRYYPKHIHIVGISEWISQCARESAVLKGFDITTIPNCIDTEAFSPIDKTIARDILNIHTNKTIILCGANNMQDFYKGFGFLLEVLKMLDKSQYLLLFFGRFESSMIENIEYKSFGYLDNPAWLKVLYNAADVFVAPSMLEAFGKTIVESLSCGTPVVAFDYSAPKDIIAHKRNGFLATAFNPTSLKDGIEWIANLDKASYSDISRYARQSAIENFSFEVVAKQYINLYKRAMGGGYQAKIAYDTTYARKQYTKFAA